MTVFELKQEHLTLLKKCCVGWQNCEFGAPEIDPKRPYGNSGVIGDMIEIFGKEIKNGLFSVTIFGKEYIVDIDCEHGDSDELIEILRTLHRETETALQIILQTQSFKIGKYRLKDKYSTEWVLIE